MKGLRAKTIRGFCFDLFLNGPEHLWDREMCLCASVHACIWPCLRFCLIYLPFVFCFCTYVYFHKELVLPQTFLACHSTPAPKKRLGILVDFFCITK